jgi:hypothetical protein
VAVTYEASSSTATGVANILSAKFAELCDGLGIRQSAGRVATCFDNSVAESFWSSLKRELISRYRFNTRAEAKAAINSWIRRYNNVRLHSTLGYMPPVEWELKYRLQGSCRPHNHVSGWRGEAQLPSSGGRSHDHADRLSGVPPTWPGPLLPPGRVGDAR